MMFDMLLLYLAAGILSGFGSGFNVLALDEEGRHPPSLSLLHVGAKKLVEGIAECTSSGNCDVNIYNLTNLSVRVANDLSFLLLHHEVYSLLGEAADGLPTDSKLRAKIEHIMSVVSFSQGHAEAARTLW
jgi:hypothetical protein